MDALVSICLHRRISRHSFKIHIIKFEGLGRKMKTGYKKELNKVYLHIDFPHLYEEDYQIPMIRENNIPGLLDVTGCGIDGKSRYSYAVTGMVSMKSRFESSPVRQEDMLVFVDRVMEVVKSVGKHMLSTNSLLLHPEFMFYDGRTWFFCYLPGRKKTLCEAFHVITEYFVQKLDYDETEGIMLAYELHKATLQENYDLEKIVEEYQLHKEQRENKKPGEDVEEGGSLPNEHLFSPLEEEYQPSADVQTIREIGGRWTPWKRAVGRAKKNRWGSWKDLIFETDGQEQEEPL